VCKVRIRTEFKPKNFFKKCVYSGWIAPPYPPQLSLTSTTTNSITIKLKPRKEDDTPIHGYSIHYKQEFGEWETVQVKFIHSK
jgi:hypothetical protein